MQIQAGIPLELIDVLQAMILLLPRRESGRAPASSGCRGAGPALDDAQTVTRSYGGERGRC